jgi:hypothetical protein
MYTVMVCATSSLQYTVITHYAHCSITTTHYHVLVVHVVCIITVPTSGVTMYMVYHHCVRYMYLSYLPCIRCTSYTEVSLVLGIHHHTCCTQYRVSLVLLLGTHCTIPTILTTAHHRVPGILGTCYHTILTAMHSDHSIYYYAHCSITTT